MLAAAGVRLRPVVLLVEYRAASGVVFEAGEMAALPPEEADLSCGTASRWTRRAREGGDVDRARMRAAAALLRAGDAVDAATARRAEIAMTCAVMGLDDPGVDGDPEQVVTGLLDAELERARAMARSLAGRWALRKALREVDDGP